MLQLDALRIENELAVNKANYQPGQPSANSVKHCNGAAGTWPAEPCRSCNFTSRTTSEREICTALSGSYSTPPNTLVFAQSEYSPPNIRDACFNLCYPIIEFCACSATSRWHQQHSTSTSTQDMNISLWLSPSSSYHTFSVCIGST